MPIFIVLAALLASVLAGCPVLSMTPGTGNAPWNDPCRTQNGPRNSEPDYGCWGSNTATTGGPEYHYVWLEGTALRIKFRSTPFQVRRKLENGGGWDTVDNVNWNKSVSTDSSGYGLGQAAPLQEDRGHVLEYFLISQSGWRNGEKFRITLSESGIPRYIDTVDVITGPGVRAYDREKFVIDSSKTY